MRLSGLLASLLAVAVALPAAAPAQVGSSTDIITGRVVGPDSQPLVGAKVDVVSAETQVTRSTRTNERGRYTVVFPDGGGQYRVTVSYIGLAPARIQLQRNADEDRLVADARLTLTPTQLAAVNVRGRQGQGGQRDAGGTERGLSPMITNRLPVDAGDLNALAALVPTRPRPPSPSPASRRIRTRSRSTVSPSAPARFRPTPCARRA